MDVHMKRGSKIQWLQTWGDANQTEQLDKNSSESLTDAWPTKSDRATCTLFPDYMINLPIFENVNMLHPSIF